MQKTLHTLIVLLSVFGHPQAQTYHSFSNGLASGRAHSYGREAVITDTLLHAMSNPGFSTSPDAVWYNEQGVIRKWVPVAADSNGRFRHEAMSNGYLLLTYDSKSIQPAILNITGNAMVYVNGQPRAGDPYASGWLHLPVELKKGRNEFLIRTGFNGRFSGIQARLELGGKPVRLNTDDATLPFLVKGEPYDSLLAGIVCINASKNRLRKLTMEVRLGNQHLVTAMPELPSFTIRKLPVRLPLPADDDMSEKLQYTLLLKDGQRLLDSISLKLTVVGPDAHASYTFTSDIDGSVQYYGVAPQKGGLKIGSSLYLSVHGAGVEAIGQARAYEPKTQGTLVAPTNRRPRGFNWEDWGRLDALEVMQIAKNKYKPDPSKIYLTGHSMGGHGSWFLGATYAGQWAAIAPCAGYPVLQSYGSADGKIPTDAMNQVHRVLLRASHPSNVLALARNYASAGVYVFHGDDDRTVSVEYARQMRKVLSEFHPDFAYREYPGGSHWFGNISVDWPPLFSYLEDHRNKSSVEVNEIDFSTASPSISSSHRWVHILQQEKSLEYSRLKLRRDTVKKLIRGTTENIQKLAIDTEPFKPGETITIALDQSSLQVQISSTHQRVELFKSDGQWTLGGRTLPFEKGLQRGGGLKDAFRHRMVFVYGTAGTAEETRWAEQKARFDAETWYYRGNGAIDIIPDAEYDSIKHAGRGVILYGNAQTNSQYDRLMRGCELRLERGSVSIGNQVLQGDDLAACIVWPKPGEHHTSVAVIGGSGLPGMKAAESNQYFAGGSGYPDFLIYRSSMYLKGPAALIAAGFFEHDWRLGSDFVRQ